MIKFAVPNIGKEEADAAYKTLMSGWVVAGKKTEEFEKEFAKYVGVKYAIFTNSCTSALKMAYKWFHEEQDKKGLLSEVIMDPNTYCATYAAANEMGVSVTWPWLDKTKGNQLDPKKEDLYTLEELSENHADNIVVVHYGGVKRNIPCVIEDSAHRIEPNDPLVGKIRCYSFYATKNMTTIQGGMFVTNDKEIYEKARLWWKDGLSTSTKDRMEGKGYDYEVRAMAGGYDSNDVFASIGLVQLKKLPEMTAHRNELVKRYNEAFGLDWTGNHLYPYPVDNVEKFYKFMKDNDIQCGYHYPGTGWDKVSLPLSSMLTYCEQDQVIKKVKEYERLR